jgi:hypothetical protein
VGTRDGPGGLRDAGATGAYLRARAPVLSAAAIYTTEESYRLRISPALGRLRLDEITRERVESFIGELLQSGASRRTVEKTHAALRVILATAVGWGASPPTRPSACGCPRRTATWSSQSSAS